MKKKPGLFTLTNKKGICYEKNKYKMILYLLIRGCKDMGP